MPKRSYPFTDTRSYKKPRAKMQLYARSTRGYYGSAASGGGRRGYYRRRVRPEQKYLDTNLTFGAAVISSNGRITDTSINLLTAGTGPSGLIGKKIVVSRISMRINCALQSSNNATLGSVVNTDSLRIILIQDKQSNGAYPAVTDVLQTANFFSMMNMDYSKRFKILKEWIVDFSETINYGTNYFTGPVDETIKWSRKTNVPIDFDIAATGVIGDVRTNNIFVLVITRNSNINASANVRIRYLDY